MRSIAGLAMAVVLLAGGTWVVWPRPLGPPVRGQLQMALRRVPEHTSLKTAVRQTRLGFRPMPVPGDERRLEVEVTPCFVPGWHRSEALGQYVVTPATFDAPLGEILAATGMTQNMPERSAVQIRDVTVQTGALLPNLDGPCAFAAPSSTFEVVISQLVGDFSFPYVASAADRGNVVFAVRTGAVRVDVDEEAIDLGPMPQPVDVVSLLNRLGGRIFVEDVGDERLRMRVDAIPGTTNSRLAGPNACPWAGPVDLAPGEQCALAFPDAMRVVAIGWHRAPAEFGAAVFVTVSSYTATSVEAQPR